LPFVGHEASDPHQAAIVKRKIDAHGPCQQIRAPLSTVRSPSFIILAGVLERIVQNMRVSLSRRSRIAWTCAPPKD
jgi:hypothetical protein